MKRKSYTGQGTEIVKTSITLPEVLVRFAEQQMAEEGFPTLSSYLVHLLHLAKEKDKHERALLAEAQGKSSRSRYPSPQPQLNEVHDDAVAPPAKKKKAA